MYMDQYTDNHTDTLPSCRSQSKNPEQLMPTGSIQEERIECPK